MQVINADAVVTIQTYDDMYEEWGAETMTVAEAMDKYSDEGCPPTIVLVRCEECAHKREENGVLRCPYSTVDLDPNGYCSRGIQMCMTTKTPMDENTKKVISEGEWGDQA